MKLGLVLQAINSDRAANIYKLIKNILEDKEFVPFTMKEGM